MFDFKRKIGYNKGQMEADLSDEWKPIETAPKDGREILVLLSNGAEAIAEYWDGPPGKEEEWGGWAVNMTASFCRDTMREDGSAEMVSWKPTPQREYDLPWSPDGAELDSSKPLGEQG